MNTQDSTPHPTLAQLAEGAAEQIEQRVRTTPERAYLNACGIRAIILRHLSPEWERLVRELDEAYSNSDKYCSGVIRIAETVGVFLASEKLNPDAVLQKVTALRSENERLRKDSNNVQAVNADLVAANERLTRELGEARHHLGDHTTQLVHEVDNRVKLEAELESLRARVLELEEDKARYQWIQDNITSATYKENNAGNLETVTLFDLLPPTVDAARKETP